MLKATPGLVPPRPVRRAGFTPIVETVDPDHFASTLVHAVRREVVAVSPGRVAVIVTARRVTEIMEILNTNGVEAVDPRDHDSKGLGADLVVLSAEGANGLEFDAVIVVEPAQITARGSEDPSQASPRGLRTLYVAMTRPTRRLAIVACGTLPDTLL